MMTVAQALHNGWQIVEPRLASDCNAALMKRKRSDGKWEFGFALWGPAGSALEAAAAG